MTKDKSKAPSRKDQIITQYRNIIAHTLSEMDHSNYGDPEVPFRMRKILESPIDFGTKD